MNEYVFEAETGDQTKPREIGRMHLPDDRTATVAGKAVGADHVYGTNDFSNPWTVYRRGVRKVFILRFKKVEMTLEIAEYGTGLWKRLQAAFAWVFKIPITLTQDIPEMTVRIPDWSQVEIE